VSWTLLATHTIAFLVGIATPVAMWHYSDFAQSARTGADTARRLRRKVDEIRGLLHSILSAAESVTDSTVEFYKRLKRAVTVLDSLALKEEDLFSLRDETLHDELEAFFAAVVARIQGAATELVPALNTGDLARPESPGRQNLAKFIYAVGQLDIPASSRLIEKLGRLSSWSGFARHRVAASRAAKR
jgi:hypothetical protein